MIFNTIQKTKYTKFLKSKTERISYAHWAKDKLIHTILINKLNESSTMWLDI